MQDHDEAMLWFQEVGKLELEIVQLFNKFSLSTEGMTTIREKIKGCTPICLRTLVKGY